SLGTGDVSHTGRSPAPSWEAHGRGKPCPPRPSILGALVLAPLPVPQVVQTSLNPLAAGGATAQRPREPAQPFLACRIFGIVRLVHAPLFLSTRSAYQEAAGEAREPEGNEVDALARPKGAEDEKHRRAGNQNRVRRQRHGQAHPSLRGRVG